MRLFVLLALCSSLSATLIPWPDLAKRTESASDIIVANVIHGTSTASGAHVSNDLVLHIGRVLKGDLTPGADVAAHLEGQGMWIATVPTQTEISGPMYGMMYGIWFLNSSSHPYTIISRDGPLAELHLAFVALPADASAPEPGLTPETSVANELVSAFRWLAGRKLSNEFWTLMENFRTLNSAATLPICRQLATEQSPLLRAVGIQGLIAANDPEGLTLAAHWNEPAAAQFDPLISFSLATYSNPDPSGVRALAVLAQREPAVQGAAYTLRAIHTKETLPALAALLDSKDAETQSQALSGFCLFVRNASAITPQSVPSLSWMSTGKSTPFLNPETQRYCHLGGKLPENATEYVNFWKSWWTAHQAALIL